jgi:hypothetical protein
MKITATCSANLRCFTMRQLVRLQALPVTSAQLPKRLRRMAEDRPGG